MSIAKREKESELAITLTQTHLLAVHESVLKKLNLQGAADQIIVESENELGIRIIEKRQLVYEAFQNKHTRGRFSATVLFTPDYKVEEVRYAEKL